MPSGHTVPAPGELGNCLSYLTCGYDSPMGLLRNATALLCCLLVVGVAIGALGVSLSRKRNNAARKRDK